MMYSLDSSGLAHMSAPCQIEPSSIHDMLSGAGRPNDSPSNPYSSPARCFTRPSRFVAVGVSGRRRSYSLRCSTLDSSAARLAWSLRCSSCFTSDTTLPSPGLPRFHRCRYFVATIRVRVASYRHATGDARGDAPGGGRMLFVTVKASDRRGPGSVSAAACARAVGQNARTAGAALLPARDVGAMAAPPNVTGHVPAAGSGGGTVLLVSPQTGAAVTWSAATSRRH